MLDQEAQTPILRLNGSEKKKLHRLAREYVARRITNLDHTGANQADDLVRYVERLVNHRVASLLLNPEKMERWKTYHGMKVGESDEQA